MTETSSHDEGFFASIYSGIHELAVGATNYAVDLAAFRARDFLVGSASQMIT